MIVFDHVSVTAPIWGSDGRPGVRTLLTDIDLKLGEQRIAVIGSNGSGKSTLLRLIDGLIGPSKGQVLVDGLDVARQTAQVRSHVGFVFTDALSQLVTSTPVEDVELSLRRTVLDRRQRRELALRLLADQGLGHVATQSIYDLSGGERQLAALVSVLAVQPRVLIADEPTTLLDLANKRRLVDALLALPQQLVVASHDLEFAAQLDRGIVVADGRIAFDGPAAQAIDCYQASVR